MTSININNVTQLANIIDSTTTFDYNIFNAYTYTPTSSMLEFIYQPNPGVNFIRYPSKMLALLFFLNKLYDRINIIRLRDTRIGDIQTLSTYTDVISPITGTLLGLNTKSYNMLYDEFILIINQFFIKIVLHIMKIKKSK